MKSMASVLLTIVLPTAASWAAIPFQVNYEGRVTVAGTPFNGNGLFRLTLASRDTSVTLWCNDGSRLGQPANSTPTAAVMVPVNNGIVSVGLGDTALANMTALPSTVFDSGRVVLRVWFDDGTHGNRLLSPDQPITSVAYAFRALRADTATTATYAAGAGSAVRSDRSDQSDRATTATYALRADTAAGSMLSTQSISSNYATTATYALRAGLSTSSMLSTQSISSNYATTATVALSLAGGGGGGGIPWQEVTAASIQAVPNHGYVANRATTVTITLPTSNTLSVGDVICVSGAGAGGWKIALNTGQTIRLGGSPDYSTWVAHDLDRNWCPVASSADGMKLVAGDFGGRIYTSADSGVTWTARDSNRNWTSMASSSDGTKLIAAPYPDRLYTSSDSGVTWTARDSSRNWQSVASSADGTKLVACVGGGQIYTSSDSGVTWTARDSSRNWIGVTSSADGTKLLACVNGGQIYTSSDSGVTWTARESNRSWKVIASSADGTKLAACVSGSQIYTSSDSGVTWTARESNRDWYFVASSADGMRLFACVYGGQIYTSSDSGVTWTAHESSRNWRGVASSADGTKLVATAGGGQIYTCDAGKTTIGPGGFITGAKDDAIELQYIGDNTFLAICSNSIAGSQVTYVTSSGTATTATIALTALNANHATTADTATTATFAVTAGSANALRGRTVAVTAPTSGQVLRWNGAAWNPATVTGGAGIPWTEVSAASIQAVANHGYVADNASTAVTITLPTSNTLSVGDIIAVSGAGVGGWKIAQNAGQKIHVRGYGVLDYSKPWTARESNRNWQGVASSADGTKLVACVSVGGQIYTSSDSGVTWTAHESSRDWFCLTSSADGAKLVACVNGGQIYTSSDSGVTWTARESNREWDGVASSADGTKLVACAWGSQIYTSPDSGVTWTARESTRNWQGVASSADGTKLVANVYGGQIYTSSDSGATWTARESDRNWNRVASSADGTKLVACAWGGQIYTSSDSGVTWTARESDRNWNRVASSANGTKLVACVLGGQIYTSSDSGVTWTARESNRTWGGIASSADGTKLVVCVYGGQIYTLDAWTPITDTTVGTAGSLTGAQYDAVELQYIGSNEFLAICHNSVSGAGGTIYQFISSNTATTATVALTALNANHATTADTATTATYATNAGHANTATTATVALGLASGGASAFMLPNYITGCELEWVDTNNIRVAPGAIELAGTLLTSGTYSANIDTSASGNWLAGSESADQWIYVYLGRNGSQWEPKLSSQPPNCNDTSSHTVGTLRYRYYSGNWYRCIGAVRNDAGGNVLSFFQHDKIITYEEPILVINTSPGDGWSAPLDCSSAMPKVSTMGVFGLYSSRFWGASGYAYAWIKRNGSSETGSVENGVYAGAYANSGNVSVGGQKWCRTDLAQRIQYQVNNAAALRISVQGYMLDIR